MSIDFPKPAAGCTLKSIGYGHSTIICKHLFLLYFFFRQNEMFTEGVSCLRKGPSAPKSGVDWTRIESN